MHEHEMQAMDAGDWIWMTPTMLTWIVPVALAVYVVGIFVRGGPLSGSDRWRRRARFLCHALEMAVAMMLGMTVLAMTFAWHEHTELAALAMAFSMTLPMLGLMRYRGHRWERGREMAAAMFLPASLLLVVLWLGLVSAQMVVSLQMLLMLPSMILLMLYRADAYAIHACTVRPRRAE
jgi:hypothetical protein